MKDKKVDGEKLALEIFTLSKNGTDTKKAVELLERTFVLLKKTSGTEVYEDVLKHLSDLLQGNDLQVATAITPVSLTKTQKEELIKYLKKKFAKDFTIKEEIDKEMGGGIKILYDDFVMDLTLEEKIRGLF